MKLYRNICIIYQERLLLTIAYHLGDLDENRESSVGTLVVQI